MNYKTENLTDYLLIREEVVSSVRAGRVTDALTNKAFKAYGKLVGINYPAAPCRCDKSFYRHMFESLEKAYKQYTDEKKRNFPTVELTYKEVVKIAKEAGIKAHGKQKEILKRLEEASIEIG